MAILSWEGGTVANETKMLVVSGGTVVRLTENTGGTYRKIIGSAEKSASIPDTAHVIRIFLSCFLAAIPLAFAS